MTISERSKGKLYPWMHSDGSSTVVYPNFVLGLERHGQLPFERFAYNALRTGIETLHRAGLPNDIEVTFEGIAGRPPWALGAVIGQSTTGSGGVAGFRCETSPFTPMVLMALTFAISDLWRADHDTWTNLADGMRREVERIGAAIVTAVKELRARGLGPGMVRLRDGLELDIESRTGEDLAYYDMTANFLVGHEFAHAYVERQPWAEAPDDEVSRRAVEILADLTSVSWMYSKYIRNTPDSESYRAKRGLKDHNEAIRENAEWTISSHAVILAFLALASAIHNGGVATLEGGTTHPNSYIRWLLQDVHFATLVLSNYGDAFSKEEADSLAGRALTTVLSLGGAGLVPVEEFLVIAGDSWRQDCVRAAEIAAAADIPELRGVSKLLADLPRLDLPDSIRDLAREAGKSI